MLECVINVSEGRDATTLAALADAAGDAVIDVHSDGDHHRSVFTLAGPDATVGEAARRLVRAAHELIDLRGHTGAHPRIGAVDVVPWVALERGLDRRVGDGPIAAAVAARDDFAHWAASTLSLPCFLYGPVSPDPTLAWPAETVRRLPDLRRAAWTTLAPDTGPSRPDSRLGAACVGARPVLVAYNLWLAQPDLVDAQRIAAAIRGPMVRALGLAVGGHVQVSCNLIEPWSFGPSAAFDAVAGHAEIGRSELVGLIPRAVVAAIPERRWAQLGLDDDATIEARLERAGLDGGRFA